MLLAGGRASIEETITPIYVMRLEYMHDIAKIDEDIFQENDPDQDIFSPHDQKNPSARLLSTP